MTEKWIPVESVDSAREQLISDIRAVRKEGTVWIFCGSANPAVYDSGEFAETVREIVSPPKQAKVLVMTAPFLLLAEERKSHALLELAETKAIALYHRNVLAVDAHFRVVETEEGHLLCHVEDPHPPLASQFRCLNRNLLGQRDQEGLANNVIAVFDAWANHPGMVTPGVLLTSAAILQHLMEQAKGADKPFDYMNQQDLLSLPGAASLVAYQPKAN